MAQNQTENANGACKHPASYALTMQTINPNIVRLEYAVRGPIVQRAGDLESQLSGGAKLPFDEVIRCNIGDAHAMDQPYITFIRQLLASCLLPDLAGQFAEDVRARAARLLGDCRGKSAGAYSESQGMEVVRRDIAAYIERRDGHPSAWQNIFIGTGASECIKVRFIFFTLCLTLYYSYFLFALSQCELVERTVQVNLDIYYWVINVQLPSSRSY